MVYKITQAMLLSAGLGSRMEPLTNTCPKPLLHVGGRPQIDYIVDSFEQGGVHSFIVNAWYLSAQVQSHFENKDNATVLVEAVRLETGGGVKNALPHLDDVFFVSNTDSIIRDISVSAMRNAFDDTMDGLLLLVPKQNAIGYVGNGDFSLNPDGTVARDMNGDYVFSGVQILRKNIFDTTRQSAFSLNVIYDKLLQSERLKGIVHNGGWYHISTPADVEKTNTLFAQGDI